MRLMPTVLVAAALGIPGTAGAQEGRGYVGGSFMVLAQDSHRQGSAPSLPTTGAGGTAIGATVEAGGFPRPNVAIGIEVSVPRRFTSVQRTDYLRVFEQESRHRDLMISGVLRVSTDPARSLRLAVVGGGGFVQESTLQRRRDQGGPFPTYPPVFGPYSDEYSFSRWTVAGLAGADVEFALAPRVALVAQLRTHFVRRSSDPSEPGWALGLGSVVWRPAIGVRGTF